MPVTKVKSLGTLTMARLDHIEFAASERANAIWRSWVCETFDLDNRIDDAKMRRLATRKFRDRQEP